MTESANTQLHKIHIDEQSQALNMRFYGLFGTYLSYWTHNLSSKILDFNNNKSNNLKSNNKYYI